MRILHSFPENESKFLTHFNALFKVSGIENTIVSSLELGYEFDKYDLIIVHNLRPSDAKYISCKIIKEKIIWFSWGTDVYKLPRISERILLPLTYRKHYDIFSFDLKKIIRRVFKDRVNGVRSYTTYRYFDKAIMEVDTMVPVIKSEYDLIRKSYNEKLNYFDLNYPVIDDFSENKNDKTIFAIIGNSAAVWNNHFDLFEKLKDNHSIKKGKIYLPLAYGAGSKWKALIKSEANKLFGNRAVFIDQLISKDEYDELIRKSKVMIMFHTRQAAMGNILTALNNNVHVYLCKDNPVYEFLTDKGFILSAISQNTSFAPLSSLQYKHNRLLMQQVYGLKALHLKLRSLLEVISE